MSFTPVRDSTGWARARARVDSQLRAYRVNDAALRQKLTVEILEDAARHHTFEPDRAPVALAAEASHRRILSWIDALLGSTPESEAVRFARGRTAVHLANLPDNWPALMLNLTDIPEELQARVRAIYLEAGPNLTFASMAPRPIDLGPISSMADETWRTFARWPALRGTLIGIVFISLLGTTFYLVRF